MLRSSIRYSLIYTLATLLSRLTYIKEKIDNHTYWVPCSANDANAKRCTYTSFEKSEIHHAKVTMADVKAALQETEELLDNSTLMIKEHEEFARCRGKKR